MSESNIKRWRMTRRGFLIGLGATTATAAVGVMAGLPKIQLLMADMVDSGSSNFSSMTNAPNAWFEITADNKIRFFSSKVEMGQGVHTSLAQIGADELEVSLDQVEVLQASTARPFADQRGTGNSDSISSSYIPLREAAASLRELLRQQAAVQLNVDPTALSLADGEIWITAAPDQRLTYGDIVAQLDMHTVEFPEDVPLKNSADFRYIGQPVERVDFKAKLMGQARYGYDMRLPNMLYGAVAHSPTIEGKLKTAAAGDAVNAPGIVAVVAEDGFAGVAAKSRQQAISALRKMALEWDEGKPWQQEEIDALVTVGNGKRVIIQNEGNAPNALGGNVIKASYRTPMAAHAHLEPQAALVDVQSDNVQAWVSTQSPQILIREIAAVTGVDEENIEIMPTYLGGGLGRKLNVEVAVEAAKLSKAAGHPVHVGWSRTEDMRHGFFRPPTHHVMRGSLDGSGRIQALVHEQASGDSLFSFFPTPLRLLFGADIGAYRGSLIQYDDIVNRQTVAHRIELPVRTGPWRGLGLLANTFAVESFVDELAHQAGVDPLQFRLAHFGSSDRSLRFKRVLNAAAERAGWGQALPEGHALGIACNIDVNTVVAQVAQVSVTNGRIRVHKVTSVVDPGMVINPDGAAAQTQGAIMMGLSSAFFEAITIKNGIIEAGNFDTYPLLTMKEAPDIEVSFLESSDTPHGMGEPPIGPIVAAVANAVFAATGQRLRQLPFPPII